MTGTDADEKPHQEITKLSDKEKMEEFMFLGLRLIKGVSGSEFFQRFGQNMWIVYGNVLNKLKDEWLIIVDMPDVRRSDYGIDVSNYVLSEFLLD